MARRTATSDNALREIRTCGECAESYDFHSPALDGHMILCRCKHRKEGGKYSIFIKDKVCELFKQRKS